MVKIVLQLPVLLKKRSKATFKVNQGFKSTSEVTDRTIAVGEAFGVGVDEEQVHQVYRNFEVNVKPGDIIYITGESGSGKSTLLKVLAKQLREPLAAIEFGKVLCDWEMQINGDEILVNGVGRDVNEALHYLSIAGLNDAFLFVRRFRELSDGQKYRYRIAKMLAGGASAWVFDEFAATLDRETAKIVSFCLQKVARTSGKTVVIATTHEDLFIDLKPSVFIRKGWGEDVHVDYHPNVMGNLCSIAQNVRIKKGSYRDYKDLSQLHYRAGKPFCAKRVFKAEIAGRVIGVIIYSTPLLSVAGRNQFLGHTATPEEVNRDFLTISRVILHPKFRGIGLGIRLVQETLPLADSKYVEAIAVMARYNPFFSKAGMTEIPIQPTLANHCIKTLESLRPFGFNPVFCSSLHYNTRIITNLTKQEYYSLISILSHQARLLISRRMHHNQKTPSTEEIQSKLSANRNLASQSIKTIAITAQPKKYYIWPCNKTNGSIQETAVQPFLNTTPTI
ncbi:MAG: ATP-binding cassette domain-containing protein [Thaumarchaeota archaeon]|nr:ATP-binding cassette domain-containing protein [Nitrososphaerota archaeon]MCL5318618.1 ATP-binding cassette domain-containing protein [Nitrososphaerota archaeon]